MRWRVCSVIALLGLASGCIGFEILEPELDEPEDASATWSEFSYAPEADSGDAGSNESQDAAGPDGEQDVRWTEAGRVIEIEVETEMVEEILVPRDTIICRYPAWHVVRRPRPRTGFTRDWTSPASVTLVVFD